MPLIHAHFLDSLDHVSRNPWVWLFLGYPHLVPVLRPAELAQRPLCAVIYGLANERTHTEQVCSPPVGLLPKVSLSRPSNSLTPVSRETLGEP